MNHVILDHIQQGKQIGFARFNDGEMGAIMGDMDTIARGRQVVTLALYDHLLETLVYSAETFYHGFPCPECFPNYHSEFFSLMKHDNKNTILAVSITNHNYVNFKYNFLNLLQNKKVLIVGQPFDVARLRETWIPNVKAFRNLQFYKTPNKNADEKSEEIYQDLVSNYDSFDYYILTCGAASRWLAYKLHQAGKSALDLGSIFEPEIEGGHKIRAHQLERPFANKLPFCPICNF